MGWQDAPEVTTPKWASAPEVSPSATAAQQPQGFWARAASREPPASLSEGTDVLGLLRRGGDWLGQKQAAFDEQMRKDHPSSAPYLEMASRLAPMAFGGGAIPRGPNVELPQMTPDPVAEQIGRINGANPAPTSYSVLPKLPKTLDMLLHKVPGVGTAAKAYDILRGITSRETPAVPASNPYPNAAPPTGMPEPMPPASNTLPSTPGAEPLAPPSPGAQLQAAAAASRQRVLRQALQDSTAEAARASPEPPLELATRRPVAQNQAPEAANAATAAAPPAQMDAVARHDAAVRARFGPGAPESSPPPAPSVLQAPPPPPRTTGDAFMAAARGAKVQSLVKAIDANAGAHLGVDPMDPRFAEALASLPPQWWEGMGQVAKINKPSAETISQAVEFFRDRSAQGVAAVAQ